MHMPREGSNYDEISMQHSLLFSDSLTLEPSYEKLASNRYIYQQTDLFLLLLAGNQYVFHICVTPFNFTSNHSTFTVSAITKNVFLNHMTEKPEAKKALGGDL
ncbi:hypothetical protein Bca101_067998 [Brassica carinata]